MELVEFVDEIKENMRTLDGYLDKKCDPEYSYALNRIKMGTCFIVTKKENGYRFYPSRFIGYIENTMDKHKDSEKKDGRKTNRAISLILNKKPSAQIELEQGIKYCEKLGFLANKKGAFGAERKYWEMY